jgi:PPOX class probable F420-dependent enzyme
VRRHLAPSDLGDLLELPLVAVLATYRPDGDVLLSPVWHEWRDGGFQVATGANDIKARHLRRDPRASIVVYEHEQPYRGIEVKGRARLLPEEPAAAVLRIAVRYLGTEAGTAYAEREIDDMLIRLEPGDLRAWDFADDIL